MQKKVLAFVVNNEKILASQQEKINELINK